MPAIEMKPATNAASVSVFVWASLFSNSASMALPTAAAWSGSSIWMMYVPALDAPVRRLVEVFEWKRHGRHVGAGILAPVGVVDRRGRRTRTACRCGTAGCAFELDGVADLPAVLLRERRADDRAAPIRDERLALVRGHHVLRVHREIGLRVDREVREEVLPVLVDALEPVAVATRLMPGSAAMRAL